MPMFSRKGLRRQWLVTVYDDDTGEHVDGPRILWGRSAEEAGDAMGLWLDLEGFDLTARMEIGPYAGPDK